MKSVLPFQWATARIVLDYHDEAARLRDELDKAECALSVANDRLTDARREHAMWGQEGGA